MNEELKESIQDDNELEVNKILQDYAMRWFVFGMGVGCVVTLLLTAIL